MAKKCGCKGKGKNNIKDETYPDGHWELVGSTNNRPD